MFSFCYKSSKRSSRRTGKIVLVRGYSGVCGPRYSLVLRTPWVRCRLAPLLICDLHPEIGSERLSTPQFARTRSTGRGTFSILAGRERKVLTHTSSAIRATRRTKDDAGSVVVPSGRHLHSCSNLPLLRQRRCQPRSETYPSSATGMGCLAQHT